MPTFVKGYKRAGKVVSAYSRKQVLGKRRRALAVMDRLKEKQWANFPENPARSNTLGNRYTVADRYLANARSAIRTRRAIGFRSRQARGYR